MRRLNAATLLVVVASVLVTACDQRPIDLGPESTGMEWRRVVEFGSDESSRDNPAVWATGPSLEYSEAYVWSRFTEPRFQHFDGSVWSAVSFQPNGGYIVEVWGSGPSDVYVTDGTVHHYDGVSWTDTGIRAWHLNGSSASNVVVSSDSLVLRFNGVAWDTLLQGPRASRIRSIAAYGTNGAYFAAGDSLLQWASGQWKSFKSPALAYDVVSYEDGMGAVAANDRDEGTTFWWFVNGVWTSFADPLSGFIDDMCIATGTVWVAHAGRLQHYDGDSWSSSTVPTNSNLLAACGHGSGLEMIDAVGGGGVALHYDDSGWDTIRSGIPGDAYSLFAVSPSDFLIGGNHGSIYHYLDGNWSEQVLPGEGRRVLAISGAAGDLFAGTESGSVYQFDGNNWALSADSLGGTYARVTDVSATVDGGVFAVGQGFIARYDGASWKRSYTANTVFQYVWALNRSLAYATTYDAVLQFDGHQWKRALEHRSQPFRGVWGTASDDVYVAAGDIFHFDGKSWGDVLPNGSHDLIVGTGRDDVLALSEFAIAHFDGALWREDGTPFCRCQPIDLVATPGGEIIRLFGEYNGNFDSQYFVSIRVTP